MPLLSLAISGFQSILLYFPCEWYYIVNDIVKWAAARDFQQLDILTSVDSGKPVQPPVKLRNSKQCSVSSSTVIEYSSDKQRLWSVCAYAQAGLSLCWSHIPNCWKSHALAQILSKLLYSCFDNDKMCFILLLIVSGVSVLSIHLVYIFYIILFRQLVVSFLLILRTLNNWLYCLYPFCTGNLTWLPLLYVLLYFRIKLFVLKETSKKVWWQPCYNTIFGVHL